MYGWLSNIKVVVRDQPNIIGATCDWIGEK